MKLAFRREQAFEAESTVRERCPTAGKEGSWRRGLISGRLKALKVKAQERRRGEIDLAGWERGQEARFAGSVETLRAGSEWGVATSLTVGSPTRRCSRLQALKSSRTLMRVAADHPAFRGEVTRGSGRDSIRRCEPSDGCCVRWCGFLESTP
jgi:hypothetical protein